MLPDNTQSPPQAAPAQAAQESPDAWPNAVSALPLFMTQRQLARLLHKSVRTLERDRIAGTGVPFRKMGKTVLYARDDVLSALDAASFKSTREAKATRAA